MLKGKEKVVEFLRFNGTPFWKIYNVGRTALISESPEEDNFTLEGSIIKIESIIDILGPGQYGLECWESAGQKKERKKTSFEIYGTSNENTQVAGIGSIPGPSGIQDMINKALDEYKKEREIESLKAEIATLKAENKELQTEADNVGTRIFNRIEPFIGAFMNGTNATKEIATSVAGAENVEEVQQRLEKAFELWATKESDPLTVVEKIAKMAVDDPGTYAMARSILLK